MAHGLLIGLDFLLQRVIRNEFFEDRHHVEAGREIARDDEPEWIAMLQVIALVEEHCAQLLPIEASYESRRNANPRSEERIAERKRMVVGHQVESPIDAEAFGGDEDAVRQRNSACQ